MNQKRSFEQKAPHNLTFVYIRFLAVSFAISLLFRFCWCIICQTGVWYLISWNVTEGENEYTKMEETIPVLFANGRNSIIFFCVHSGSCKRNGIFDGLLFFYKHFSKKNDFLRKIVRLAILTADILLNMANFFSLNLHISVSIFVCETLNFVVTLTLWPQPNIILKVFHTTKLQEHFCRAWNISNLSFIMQFIWCFLHSQTRLSLANF